MTTAFIAGATGYSGSAVVHELSERGLRAIAHVRSDSPRLAEWRTRFAAVGAQVDSTPWQADALQATFARLQPDLVFALLGTTRARAKRDAAAGHDSTYQSVDYGLSKLLLDVTRVTRPSARFIYLSSLGVSAATRNEYLAVRWKFEQELRASRLDHLIARPSFITGPDREETRPTERIVAATVDRLLRVVAALGGNALRELYGSLTGKQLARALVNAALAPELAHAVLDTRALRKLAGLS